LNTANSTDKKVVIGGMFKANNMRINNEKFLFEEEEEGSEFTEKLIKEWEK
jgi:NAD dependent epimerase/dehydratase family enzyme